MPCVLSGSRPGPEPQVACSLDSAGASTSVSIRYHWYLGLNFEVHLKTRHSGRKNQTEPNQRQPAVERGSFLLLCAYLYLLFITAICLTLMVSHTIRMVRPMLPTL